MEWPLIYTISTSFFFFAFCYYVFENMFALKSATSFDPNLILPVTPDKSCKMRWLKKNMLESRTCNTKVWLHYCEIKCKALKSPDRLLTTMIKNKATSVGQVATSGNCSKHHG